MLERLEDIYLNIFRYLLIIGASIAVLVGVINLLISLSLIFDTPSKEKINTPVWSEIKYDILPISQPKTQEEEVSIDSKPKEKQTVPADPRLNKVLKNLDKLFTGEEIKFSSKNTITSLSVWVSSSGLTEDYQIDAFLDGLLSLSKDISTEKRILQIGDPNSRIDTIYESLESFMTNFLLEITRVENINDKNNEISQGKNIQGFSDLQITLYAALIFVLVLLIVLIFKVEFNLRKIAPSIQAKK
tara:strand:- start:8898 stop:9629 length:732 start_codon:yes stop_codon:yes gene_type:complete